MKNRYFLVVLCLLLTSCGEEAISNAQTETDLQTAVTETAETTAEQEAVPILPEADYKGDDFCFLNGNTASWMTTYVVTAEEEVGEAVNDAIFQRNRATEEQFNVKITEISTKNLVKDAQKSIQAGDDTFDVILMTMNLDLIVNNMVLDFTEIPHLDLSAPWWIQKPMKDLTICGKTYCGMSLFDTTHYDSTRPVLFNKKLIADYDMESPYALVRDGKWTLEKFREMGMTAAKDIDGDGTWTEADQYGLTTWYGQYSCTVPTGIGAMMTVTKDEEDLPYFDLNTAYYIERLTAAADLYVNYPGLRNPAGNADNNGGVEVFREGRALFYIEGLGNAQKLRQMDIDFGIVPAPKYNEEQKDYISHGGYPFFMMIPTTNSDLDRTGVLLESLAYESMKTVKPAFYDNMLMGKITRDNDSEEMLDIVFSTLQYDLPIALTEVFSRVAEQYIQKGNTDFASYFTKIEDKVQKQIDDVIDAYKANVNS